MKLLGFLLILLTGQVSFAQETLKLDRASREYDLVIHVQACGGEAQHHDANTCNGPGRVSLSLKFSVRPQCPLCLCGEQTSSKHSPQRH